MMYIKTKYITELLKSSYDIESKIVDDYMVFYVIGTTLDREIRETTIAKVSRIHTHCLKIEPAIHMYEGNERKHIYSLLIAFAETRLEHREKENKKMEYILTVPGMDKEDYVLNYNTIDDEYIISNRVPTKKYKVSFTQEEIDEMPECYQLFDREEVKNLNGGNNNDI